jgi:hypothetical protein
VVVATPEVTLYVIDSRRSAQVVLDVLGKDFGGTLVSSSVVAAALGALSRVAAWVTGERTLWWSLG